MTVSLMISGCQLAVEGSAAGSRSDKLVGVLITKEHLDLFDVESFNTNELLGGRSGIARTRSGDEINQGRLYATTTHHFSVDEDTGETFEHFEHVFEGIDGFAFFVYTAQSSVGSFTGTTSDETIVAGRINMHHGDDDTEMVIEGTVFVLPSEHTVFYINPVYQSANGSVFVTTGSGIAASGSSSEGMVMSQTLNEKTTVTENGKAMTQSTTVTISIAIMFAPQSVSVLQMRSDSTVNHRTDYTPGALPESIIPESGTAYIIVESQRQGEDGESVVSRMIYDKLDSSFATFYARPDGICIQQVTMLEW